MAGSIRDDRERFSRGARRGGWRCRAPDSIGRRGWCSSRRQLLGREAVHWDYLVDAGQPEARPRLQMGYRQLEKASTPRNSRARSLGVARRRLPRLPQRGHLRVHVRLSRPSLERAVGVLANQAVERPAEPQLSEPPYKWERTTLSGERRLRQ